MESGGGFDLKALVRQNAGPSLIGSYLAAVLYGATAVQTYLYFNRHCKRDAVPTRIFVAVLSLLDTLNIACLMHTLWRELVEYNGDIITALTTMSRWPTLQTFDVTSATIIFLVQIFYAYRVWLVSEKSFVLPTFIAALSIASFIQGPINLSQQLRGEESSGTLIAGMSLSVAADLFISAGLVHYLLKARESAIKSTETIVDKLIVYSLTTGGIAGAENLLTLLLGVIFPESAYLTISYFPMCKVYVNCLLALLNARDHLKKGVAPLTVPESSLPNVNYGPKLYHSKVSVSSLYISCEYGTTIGRLGEWDMVKGDDGRS
ncbi:hypothetical protein L218DRAFT_990847 [Marasmius fiardii PR-910]|nr:hypothetical protein L218DRAFT_990847 [Marasmius fiardii PR-910]